MVAAGGFCAQVHAAPVGGTNPVIDET